MNQRVRAPNGEPHRWLDAAFDTETDECLLWPYARTGSNSEYGSVSYPNERGNELVHRIINERNHGPCPPGMESRHLCGNGLCCNKRHLVWDTKRNNEADKIRHGTLLVGEKNHSARITQEQVDTIEKRLRETTMSCKAIASEAGVDAMTVSNVNRKKHRLSTPGDPIRMLARRIRAEPCLAPGCTANGQYADGYCSRHHRMLKLYGTLDRVNRTWKQ